MRNKSKNKFLLFSVVSILTMFLGIVSADAKTINKDDVPSSTYIIGTHMFTRTSNSNYDGRLTTKLIMLAAKTIDGDSIDNMIIYYKTASGKWIDGLSGKEIKNLDSFEINYKDTEVLLETPKLIIKDDYLTLENLEFYTKNEGWEDEISGLDYKIISSITYYRYRDLVYKWKTTTKSYYSESSEYIPQPSSEYVSDSIQTGWKWYKEIDASADSQKVMAKPFQMLCHDSSSGSLVRKNIWKNGSMQADPCKAAGLESSFTIGGAEFKSAKTYTCDDPESGTAQALKSGNADTICSASCNIGTLSDDKTTCTYKTKNYYQGYYVSAPENGAKKDESTATQVSNEWHKVVTTITDEYYATAPSNDATKVGTGIWESWSDYQTTKPEEINGTRQTESRQKINYEVTNKIDGWEIYEKTGKTYNLLEVYDLSNSAGLYKLDFDSSRIFVARTYRVNAKGEKVYSNYSKEVSSPALSVPTLTEDGMGGDLEGMSRDYKISDIEFADGIEVYKSINGKDYSLEKVLTKTDLLEAENKISTVAYTGEHNYYKVRAYKEVNGKKVYSEYSEIAEIVGPKKQS